MLTLDTARQLIRDCFGKGAELGLKPLSVAVLDPGGHVIAFERQDGASNLRFHMAHAKANGSLALGIGSRAIFNRAQQQPYFTQAVNALCDGALLPVPGGALIRDSAGAIVGAIGVTGDTSDNDEDCLVYAVERAGLVADTG
jgi:uncharacterized protein GlcG (DUF336 family)